MKARGNYAAVSVEYVAQQYEANQMIIVDSRPKRAKFDKGHIPSAISIPDTQFDKLKGKLPADKATPLVFYCGGFT
jgi:rhodanese-related sulfurtransferase